MDTTQAIRPIFWQRVRHAVRFNAEFERACEAASEAEDAFNRAAAEVPHFTHDTGSMSVVDTPIIWESANRAHVAVAIVAAEGGEMFSEHRKAAQDFLTRYNERTTKLDTLRFETGLIAAENRRDRLSMIANGFDHRVFDLPAANPTELAFKVLFSQERELFTLEHVQRAIAHDARGLTGLIPAATAALEAWKA